MVNVVAKAPTAKDLAEYEALLGYMGQGHMAANPPLASKQMLWQDTRGHTHLQHDSRVSTLGSMGLEKASSIKPNYLLRKGSVIPRDFKHIRAKRASTLCASFITCTADCI